MNKILFRCFLAGVLVLNGGCDWIDRQVESNPNASVTPAPTPPDPEAAGGIVNTHDGALAVNGSSYTFVIDVYVADAAGNLISGLGLNDFSTDSTEANIDTVTNNTIAVTDYFSSALLVDQSGSMIDADPFDIRIEAAKTFFSALSGNDNAALYAFTGSGANRKIPGDSIVSPYSDGFTQTLDEAFVDTLKDLEGGDTPLFDSIYLTLDLTITNAQNIYKYVIVLTDGIDDTVDGPTYGGIDAAIDHANSLGIKIHTIGLGANAGKATLAQLSSDTGGIYTLATNAEQLEAILTATNALLSGGGSYYSVQITVNDVNAGLAAGDTLTGNILIRLNDGSVVTVPYIATIV